LTTLCCLLALLVSTGEGAHRHYGRSNRGRGLRRLAAAGILLGAGAALGYAIGRGKRSTDSELEVEEGEVFSMLGQLDQNRCMEVWVCDMMAREEDELAEEELDIAALFSGEQEQEELDGAEAGARDVYYAAAERGLNADGDRSVCQVPSCSRSPAALLQALRAASFPA